MSIKNLINVQSSLHSKVTSVTPPSKVIFINVVDFRLTYNKFEKTENMILD